MAAYVCSRIPDGTVGSKGYQAPEATKKGGYGLPPDIFSLVRPYKKWWGTLECQGTLVFFNVNVFTGFVDLGSYTTA